MHKIQSFALRNGTLFPLKCVHPIAPTFDYIHVWPALSLHVHDCAHCLAVNARCWDSWPCMICAHNWLPVHVHWIGCFPTYWASPTTLYRLSKTNYVINLVCRDCCTYSRNIDCVFCIALNFLSCLTFTCNDVTFKILDSIRIDITV